MAHTQTDIANKRLFILAGEPSGDALGSALVLALKARQPVHIEGVGGEKLSQAGLVSIFPMSDLSVMGFVDVLRQLPRLLWRVRQTIRHILSSPPDLVLLIDSQEFSNLVAKGLRKRGYAGPIVLYVAPSVWAWRPERANAIKPIFDEILAVLPFEPKVFAELDGPNTTYVGHSALDRIDMRAKASRKEGPVLLFPGSRRGEIGRHMPVFKQVASALIKHADVTHFVIPTLAHLRADLETEVSSWDVPVRVIVEAEDRLIASQEALVAIASAGTVTLELALAGVPHVMIYVPDMLQRRAYDKAGRPLIGLPNIIMGKPIVPEIDVQSVGVDVLEQATLGLIAQSEVCAAQLGAFSALRTRMENGDAPHGKKDAVDRVLYHLLQN